MDENDGWEGGNIEINGVDLEDLVADFKDKIAGLEGTVAGLEGRLDAIERLAAATANNLDEAKALLTAIRILADSRRKGGIESGKKRSSKPWHIHARGVAIDKRKADPAIGKADLAVALMDDLDGNKILHPDQRQIERFITALEAEGTIPPQAE
jgi:hypothetical protein